ncbi:hypothetical protein KO561_02010 [Radiobacillus kanasensis]|uniref:hypothetical protein n=1 Tax=Radiobacillus kanasensis TaxID=2844358 RepID=UPI001E470C3E|nr:hypothetical protein [Radiobacillus kanasensis]UFT99774.1 hypothetical protein KO561_02010 [Radiobacillus kanasensis]
MDFKEYRNQITEKNDELYSLISSFWSEYSGLGTWQFWVVLSSFILPLIVLWFIVDRKRIFEVFFFGYTVHLLWSYINLILEQHSYMVHPYSLSPILPYAINLTSSVLPVSFLLIYQYCTKNNKNFYMYILIISAIFSFVLVPLESQIGLLDLNRGFNHVHIFAIDIGITFIAYWATLFVKRIRLN